ncbi:hypothetical protein OG285_00905 [Streptomyces sp. NBC_01471]
MTRRDSCGIRGVETCVTARSEWGSLAGAAPPRTRPVTEADYLSTWAS